MGDPLGIDFISDYRRLRGGSCAGLTLDYFVSTLAVDPGIRGCGYAYFEGARLYSAGYIPNTIRTGDGMIAIVEMARSIHAVFGGVDALAVEWQQIYRGKSVGADLLPLSGIVSALAALCCQVRPIPIARYLPHEWKGNITPEAMILRIKSRVSQDGAKLYPPRESLAHNMWDAVGIGLHHLGRLQPRRVIARGTRFFPNDGPGKNG